MTGIGFVLSRGNGQEVGENAVTSNASAQPQDYKCRKFDWTRLMRHHVKHHDMTYNVIRLQPEKKRNEVHIFNNTKNDIKSGKNSRA